MQQIHLKHNGFFLKEKKKKSTVSYFVITNKVTLRLLWKGKRLKKANTMLKKNVNKVRGLTLPNSETYYKAPESKTTWHWQKQQNKPKHPKQTNRSMNQNTRPRHRHTIEPTDLWREQRQCNGERTAFQQTCWNWIFTCQNRKKEKKNLDTDLKTVHKN